MKKIEKAHPEVAGIRASARTYYRLTKPGIIYGNVITTIGGFLLASRHHWHFSAFLGAIVGSAAIIGGACVFNNYLDRKIDKKMARTQNRPLVTGAITTGEALRFGSFLTIAGFVVLASYTNAVTLFVGAIGFVFYVAVYGYFKRRSLYGTIIGSISGAAPVVAGYTAASGRLDGGAFLLFIILASWQMPHFYAIAMYRSKDYKAAGIPVMPLKRGMIRTKRQIMAYIIIFIVACGLLSFSGHANISFLGVMTLIGAIWFIQGLEGYADDNSAAWGRKMFKFSLITIMALAIMLSLNPLLP